MPSSRRPVRRPHPSFRKLWLTRLEDRVTPATVAEVEPNNVLAAATAMSLTQDPTGGPLFTGLATGALAANDADYFTFPAKAGDTLLLEGAGAGAYGSSLVLELRTAGDITVASANDYSGDRPRFAPVTIPADGTYAVKARTSSGTANAGYTFRVDLARGAAVEAEPNSGTGSTPTPVPLSPGAAGHATGRVVGNVSAGDTDEFALGLLPAGNAVTVTLAKPTGSTLDGKLELTRGPAGTVVATGSASVAFTVPGDDLYYVRVSPVAAGTAGVAANYVLAADMADATSGRVLTVTPPAAPAAGRGLRFDGIDDYARLPNGLLAGSLPRTYELWFRTTASGALLVAQNAAPGATVTDRLPLLYVGTDGRLYGGATAGSTTPINSSASVADGIWHHAALVTTAATQALFLDGGFVGSLAGAPAVGGLAVGLVGTGDCGSWPATPGGAFPFNGAIDEVRVWTTARTQADLIAGTDGELTGPAPGLVAVLNLNETAGATAADASGLGNHATLGAGAAAPAWAALAGPFADPAGVGTMTLVAGLSLTFSEPPRATAAADPANYRLTAGGPDGQLGTADDTLLQTLVSFDGDRGVTLTLPAQPLQPGRYRFETVAALTDRAGNPFAALGRTFDVVPPAGGAIESTSNDLIATATPLPFADLLAGSGVRTGNGVGTLGSATDVDFWRIDVIGGEAITARLEAGDGELRLVNAAGDTIGYGSSGVGGTDLRDVIAPATGAYYLRVRGAATPGYTLRVDRGRPGELELEVNDSPTYVANNLTFGAGGTAQIAGALPAADTAGDYFRLGALAAGTGVTLSAAVPAFGTLAAADVRLTVVTAGGTAVATAAGPSLLFTAPAADSYFVRVTAAAGRSNRGQYLLTATLADATAPTVAGLGLGATTDVVDGFTLTLSEALAADGVLNGVRWGGHTYRLTPAAAWWTQSEAFAVAMGGHLATVNGPAENEFLRQALGRAWIGLTGSGATETFGWVSGEPLVYTNWGNYTPYTSAGQDFGLLTTSAGGVWYGYYANAAYRGVVELPAAAGLTVEVRGAGPDGKLDTADDTFRPTTPDAGYVDAATLRVRLLDGPLAPGTYRVTASGATDRSGNALVPFAQTITVAGVAPFTPEGLGNDAAAAATPMAPVVPGRASGTVALPTGQYAVGPQPGRFATADFNGDGRPDLVVPVGNSGAAGWVQVMFGQADGGFALGGRYPVGVQPDGVRLGDFTGDGVLDAAVANSGNTSLSVLPGTGGGAFGATVNVPLLELPTALAAGDFNGDGRFDLAVASALSSAATILLGQPGGSFSTTTFAAGSGVADLVAADVTGDGKLDLLAVQSDLGRVAVFPGTGAGGFGSAVTSAAGNYPATAAVGDFNGDGKLDVAVGRTGSYSDVPGVLLGTGTGGFGPVVAVQSDNLSGPRFLVAADLDGDGTLDLAATGNGGGVVTYRGAGDGTFGPEVQVGVGASNGNTTYGIAVGDATGDGLPDVITALRSPGLVTVYPGNPEVPLPEAFPGTGIRVGYARGSVLAITPVSYADDTDLFRFSAAAGSQLGLTLETPLASYPTLSARVYAPQGGTVASVGGSAATAGSSAAALTRSGTYVFSIGNNGMADYRARVIVAPAGVLVESDSYGANNTTAGANAPAFTQAAVGTARATVAAGFGLGDPVDFFRVGTVVAGTAIGATVTQAATGGATIRLNLVNASGVTVATTTAATLTYTVPAGADGVYYVGVVATAGATITAAYKLDLTLADGLPPVVLAASVPRGAAAGGGLGFDGTDDHVVLPSLTFGGAATVETWAYLTSLKANARFIDLGAGAATDNLTLGQDTSGKLYLDTYDAGAATRVTADAALPLNQWVHVAGVNDGAGGVTLYVNGVAVKAGTGQKVLRAVARTGYLGRATATGVAYFAGQMDGARVWNAARSVAQLRAGMDATVAATAGGLLADYAMDEAAGMQLLDASAAARHATLAADTAAPARVTFGTTAELLDRFTVTVSEDLDPATVNGTTVTYKGHRYTLTPTAMTWAQAEAYAVGLGGHLATIDDYAEYDFARQQFGTAWIGLTDAAAEGQYVWADGTPAAYTYWREDQPDNTAADDYAQLGPTGWSDLAATATVVGLVELPSLATPAVDLRAAGPDGQFDTADDALYSVAPTAAYTTGNTIALRVVDRPLAAGNYRLRVGGYRDKSGNPMAAPFDRPFAVAAVAPYVVEREPQTTPLAAPSAGGSGTVTPVQNWLTGPNAQAVVAVDLNNDGRPDVVSASAAGQVFVQLGSATGLGRPVAFAAPAGVTRLAAGDFDNDGNPDVAVAGPAAGVVGVLRGGGDGTLAAAVTTPAALTVQGLAVADFNADGKLDLATGNGTAGTVSVYLGAGNGAFTPTGFAAPNNATVTAIAAADLTGDGKADLLLGGTQFNVSYLTWVFAGTGAGGFTQAASVSLSGSAGGVLALTVADLNADGKPDYVADSYAGASVVLAQGAGFAAAQPVSGSFANTATRLADLDGDGNLDLVAVSTNRLTTAAGFGTGAFATPVTVTLTAAAGLAVGDFTGDGRPDAVVATNEAAGRVWLLAGDPARRPAESPAGSGVRTLPFRGRFATGSGSTDPDRFTFSGRAGETVQFAVEPTAGGTVNVSLYLPTGVVGGTTTTYGSTRLSLPYTLTMAGTYTLVVTPFSDVAGEYRGRVTLAPAGTAVEAEPNDSTTTATAPPFTLGADGVSRATAVGTVYTADAGDLFRLGTLPAGHTVTVQATPPAASGVAATLAVVTAAGTAVATTTAATLTYTVPAGGDGAYFVRVTGTGGVLGQYRLALAVADTTPPAVLAMSLPRPAGGALAFDGTDDAATLPATTFGGAVTLEAWVFLTGYAANGTAVELAAGGADVLVLRTSGTTGRPEFGVGNAATFASVVGDAALPLNEWVHLAGVSDGAGNATLAVNGVVVKTGTGQQVARTVARPAASLGRGGAGGFLAGRLDGVRVWNAARTLDALRAGLDAPVAATATGLIADYRLDEAAGATLLDSSAAARHATLAAGSAAPARVAAARADALIDRFTLTVTEALTSAAATAAANYDLRGRGADGLFDTADDAVFAVTPATPYAGGSAVVLRLARPLPAGEYRVRVTGLADPAGNVQAVAFDRLFGIDPLAPFVDEQEPNDTAATATPAAAVGPTGDGSFTPRPTLTDAGPAAAVVAADFNGDGRPDLASVSGGTVAVRLGTGGGAFGPAATYASGLTAATWLAAADLNADGRPDLVTATAAGGGTVAVLLNGGTGTFGPAAASAAGGGNAFALADATGDGRPDLLATNAPLGRVLIRPGFADGTFGSAATVTVTAGAGAVAVADFTGDGVADLAVGYSAASAVEVRPGIGGGQFGPAVPLPTLPASYPRALLAADVTGDGRPDLVVGQDNSLGQASVFPATAGGFGPRRDLGAGGSGDALAAADLDGDGRLDVVTAGRINTGGYGVAAHLNLGTGGFGRPVAYLVGAAGVAAADFDGDGRPDLAVASDGVAVTGGVAVLLGNPVVTVAESPAGSGVRTALVRGRRSATAAAGTSADVDGFRFSARGGETLFVTAELPPGVVAGTALTVRLVSPGGTTLVTGSVWTGAWQSAAIPLVESGSYTVFVGGTGQPQDEYRVRVTVAAAVESEANDTAATATPAALAGPPGTLRAAVAGLIATADPGDHFALGTFAAGTTVALTTRLPAGSTLAPRVELLRNGVAVTDADGNPTDGAALAVTTAGVYTARVTGPAGAGLLGGYVLDVVLTDATPPAVAATTLPAAGVTTTDLITAVTLTATEDLDPTTVAAAGGYDLRAAGPDGQFGTADDAVYTLVPAAYASGLTAGVRVTDGPLQPGDYRFTAAGLRDRFGNPLAAPFVRTFGVAALPGYPTEGRSNDGFADATPVAVAEALPGLRQGGFRGSLAANPDGVTTYDNDWFAVPAQAGDRLTLTVDQPGDGSYYGLDYSVFTPTGLLVGSYYSPAVDGDGQSGTFTLAAAGDYRVWVGTGYNIPREYRVRVTLAQPAAFALESEPNGTAATAAALPLTNGDGHAAGVVQFAGDLDYFALGQVAAGQTVFLTTRTPAGSPLDAVVGLYNASNVLVAEVPSGRPSDGVAEVRVTAAGNYYAAVRAAHGTAGGLSAYALDVRVEPTGATAFANLQVTAVSPPTVGLTSGQPVALAYTVGNVGGVATPVAGWVDRVALSANAVAGDADDIVIGLVPHAGALAAGASYSATPTLTVPDGIAGTFYVVVQADAGAAVDEYLLDGDNATRSTGVVVVTLADYSDLRVEGLAVAGNPDGTFTATWAAANRGTGPAAGGFAERVEVRDLATGTVVATQTLPFAGDLAATATAARSATFAVPAVGTYRVTVLTDSGDQLYEWANGHAAGEANNSATVALAVPPRVAGVTINDGQAQRSALTRVVVRFSGPVTLAANAIRLTTLAGAAVPYTLATTTVSGATVATLTFAGGSLADGTYRLAVAAAGVADAAGNALDGNGDGAAGDDYQYAGSDLFRFLADFDGDGAVDGNDLAYLAQAFNSVDGDSNYRWWLDLDGDGAVDGNDLAVLAQRFNTVL